MRNKKVTSGVIYRRTSANLTVRTVFGTTVPAMKRCNTCKQIKYRSEWYLDYRTSEPRNQCDECWDKYNGVATPNKKGTTPLPSFVFECEEVK